MVLPNSPPTTAPPTVPAMQLNSELWEWLLCECDGLSHAANAPKPIRAITNDIFLMVFSA